MTNQRLYIVHGMGTDGVGLVGSITTPIAEAGGNIVDLRQDVLHGLFTLFMVVDLSHCSLRIDDFRKMVRHLGEDTGLTLSVDKYVPIPRGPDNKNLLLVVLGNDKPGVIASVSKLLSKYQINIEFSQTIAREGIFLMELLTDVSRCAIPIDNLRTALQSSMAEMEMNTFFQSEDVFNKKKRTILFQIESSFMDPEMVTEIVQQTSLKASDLSATYKTDDPRHNLNTAASLLEGFPLDVLFSIIEKIEPTPGTVELLQTFKIMGYRVALVSSGFSPFIEFIKTRLDIDQTHGIDLPVDNDARTVTGQPVAIDDKRVERIAESIVQGEGISQEEITVISDSGTDHTPGIRLQFDLEKILDYYNQHILSKENLLGLLGSFGLVRL
jgi:phosphoserine phosphatase